MRSHAQRKEEMALARTTDSKNTTHSMPSHMHDSRDTYSTKFFSQREKKKMHTPKVHKIPPRTHFAHVGTEQIEKLEALC